MSIIIIRRWRTSRRSISQPWHWKKLTDSVMHL